MFTYKGKLAPKNANSYSLLDDCPADKFVAENTVNASIKLLQFS